MLTQYECPSSDMIEAGLSLTTVSRSLARGPMSGMTVLLQPEPLMAGASGLAVANAAMSWRYDAIVPPMPLRTTEKSILPVKLEWVCESMKPGSIILPSSLTTLVDGPTKPLAPRSEPT